MQAPYVENSTQSEQKLRTTPTKDAADTFIVLSSLLLTVVSIALAVLVFVGQALKWDHIPGILQVLQRVISALALSVTSSVVVLVGKRYVFAQLSEKGIKSQRIAVYVNSSISNLLGHFMRGRLEGFSLALFAFWLLGLATGLTANNTARLAPLQTILDIGLPVGSLDPKDISGQNTSLVAHASAELDFVVSSLTSGVDGIVGLINVTGAETQQGVRAGSIYYPPLPDNTLFSQFDTTAFLNGFQVSIDSVNPLPSSAQMLNCYSAYTNLGPTFYFVSGDTQKFAFIYTLNNSTYYQVTSTAVVMGGRLTSDSAYTEFALDGSTSSLTMSDSQWASQIMEVICSTVTSSGGFYSGTSLVDFAYFINQRDMYNTNSGSVSEEMIWTTVLGLVVGAYSATKWPLAPMDYQLTTAVSLPNNPHLAPYYGVYVLIAYIIASLIMLLLAWRLGTASGLHTDFLNPTRLLLDPLRRPDLFDASLQQTIRALGDPYIQVTRDSQLVFKGQKDG
ncbi:hypothetical protein V8B97DRAFT_1294656 [Scleroderma yunnanense]